MRRILITLIFVFLMSPLALANDDSGVSDFALESELLSQVPEIAAALDAVEANRGDAGAWRRLGTLLSKRAAHNDALRALEIAVARDESDPDSWTDYGAALIRAKDLGGALDALERALEIEPFHAVAHYNTGLARLERKNYDGAMEAFKAALMLEPKLGDPVHNPAAANNPVLNYAKLEVYLETTGATPALFSGDQL